MTEVIETGTERSAENDGNDKFDTPDKTAYSLGLGLESLAVAGFILKRHETQSSDITPAFNNCQKELGL